MAQFVHVLFSQQVDQKIITTEIGILLNIRHENIVSVRKLLELYVFLYTFCKFVACFNLLLILDHLHFI